MAAAERNSAVQPNAVQATTPALGTLGSGRDLFDVLMIEEPRDRRFLAGKDFFGRGADEDDDLEVEGEGEGDDDDAPPTADDDACTGLTDADVENNPFPRAVTGLGGKPSAGS
mmetsp:Transcript_37635/g.86973  ORF Transcript_37635/g.86973 Transcript_37635/m.86973 type:complete len:113 (+) Transcript_37635:2-340(+)